MGFIGKLIKIAGWLVSLWVLFGAATTIMHLWGILALLAAMFVFPLTWTIFPFYAGIALDNWGYLQWWAIGFVLILVGTAMQAKADMQ